MYNQDFETSRTQKRIDMTTDIVIVGGGLTGVCCALTAARRGVKVILVQDRPVLGGNASSEVRIWALGATSHMGNNNRWSREGGVINEIMTENVYRNKEGNPVIFDTVLLDIVMREPNITLLLNTIVYEVHKNAADTICSVEAYNPINETRYEISGKFFADCSGDGLISYLAGASYRMGAEDETIYGEGFSPDLKTYGELLGHTIIFYMKDTGKPVKYVAPSFALKDADKHISKIKNDEYFSTYHAGCKYWWIEYGGRLDTIHDSEHIKRELWKVVYGIWDYIKNSGLFPQMETYTLEWVGTIPGKRESRRINGLYTLTQVDITRQREHYDAVAHGGWAIDLHPADGVYADGRACNQWHSKGVYQIPYRCYLGNEISNLMFGGRIMSASHVANGSTRVMCTSAAGGQVIGMALALCVLNNRLPADYTNPKLIGELQNELIAIGQYIPGHSADPDTNLLSKASLKSSSENSFNGYSHNGKFRRLKHSTAALFPTQGRMPSITLPVKADCDTELNVELRCAGSKQSFTPDCIIEHRVISLRKGLQTITIDFGAKFEHCQYVFVCFMANDKVELGESDDLLTGTTTVINHINPAVSNYGRQDAPPHIGFDSFEFWCPERRPQSKNLAFTLDPAQPIFSLQQLTNGYTRPEATTNAWAASITDPEPRLTVKWDSPQTISSISLFFDGDFDHAMETVQMGHHEAVMPQCVRSYVISDAQGNELAHVDNNYQALNIINLPHSIVTDSLDIRLKHPVPGHVPASVFYISIN